MMAEIEVSKAATLVKDNCGWDTVSYQQDLPKPDCNGVSHPDQGNGSDSSCVSVTGDNGLTDEIKENEVAGVESMAAVEVQNEKFDFVNGKVSEEEKGNVEGDQKRSPEDRHGIQTAEVGAPVKEHKTKGGSQVEEADTKQFEDSNGIIEISEGAQCEMTRDQDENFEKIGREKVNYQIKLESSPTPVENHASQVWALEVVPESEEKVELNKFLSHNNGGGSTNCECEDQTNLSSSETTRTCQGSPCNVADVVKIELPEESMVVQDEVKFEIEVVETEVPLPSFVVCADTESCPFNTNEETLEAEGKINLGSDDTENQNGDTASGSDIQDGLEQAEEAKTGVSTDRHVCALVLEEQSNNDMSVSRAKDSFRYPEETEEHPDGNGVSLELMPSKSWNEVSVPTQSLAKSYVCEPRHETDMSVDEIVGFVSSSPADGPKSQIVEYDPSGKKIMCAADDASLTSDSVIVGTIVCRGKKQTCQGGDSHVESKVSSGKLEVVSSSTVAVITVELEPAEVRSCSAISSEDTTTDLVVTCRKDAASSVGEFNIVLENHDVKSMEDQFDESTDENFFLQQNEGVGNSQSDSISMASQEGSNNDTTSEEDTSMKTVTMPFNYLIRVPRFNDETLKEQARLAKLQVDEKTKLRNDIQVQIQEKRASSRIHGVDYELHMRENRSARKLVKSKRMEIDSLQSMVNKAKNAISIEDINSRISEIDHVMQHETLPLKEEKQLILEIKQLKRLRGELSSNIGNQDEIKEALEQKEELEERLKISRKELDTLKAKALKAEAAAAEANEKYSDENEKITKLQVQFRAADVVRQEAYAQWQSLKKELWEMNKHFFKYKDDATAANNYAFSRDREALHQHCTNQVEKVMELWNTNTEFRKQYVSSNVRSTVLRFGSLDGRSLGPGEKPAVLPSYVNERVHRMVSTPTKVVSISQSTTLELKEETPFENGTSDDKSIKKATKHKNQMVKTKTADKPELGNGFATVAGQDVPEEVQEEPMKSREEIEMARKAEEKDREEAEAKLKEQRRLDALAKANEARERKKRQAEKIQMRADLKAKKEAEEKEKEREKRLKKKERKKAAVDSNDSNSNNCDSTPSSESGVETGKETEAKDVSSMVTKKHQKPSTFMKQSKMKSIPPPLRNRNRKNWQQYAWVVATSLLVFMLFWLGNIGVFSNVNLKRPGPFY